MFLFTGSLLSNLQTVYSLKLLKQLSEMHVVIFAILERKIKSERFKCQTPGFNA